MITVFIPDFNEELNISRIPKELMPVLNKLDERHEVLIVDDDSIDNTVYEINKLAPVISEIKQHSNILQPVVCVVVQHRELLDHVLDIFYIQSDYDLNIMRQNQTLTDITCFVLKELKNILVNEQPDILLILGDTTTILAASLAAYYHKVRIGHVEAGLRTHNKYQPFPEEMRQHKSSKIRSCTKR